MEYLVISSHRLEDLVRNFYARFGKRSPRPILVKLFETECKTQRVHPMLVSGLGKQAIRVKTVNGVVNRATIQVGFIDSATKLSYSGFITHKCMGYDIDNSTVNCFGYLKLIDNKDKFNVDEEGVEDEEG